MRNAQVTKEKLVSASADLFNTKGYRSTAISDITRNTGYTKGAIYRHYTSKEHLEAEAFDYLTERVFKLIVADIKKADNAKDKLNAVIRFFKRYQTEILIKGGCPILNLATEIDDIETGLKKKAQNAVNIILGTLHTIIENGKKYGQIKPETETDIISLVIFSSIEGALMQSKLFNGTEHLNKVCDFLETEIVKKICVE
jgi:TetR/AcrR family transcriptional regulator, transcriptional repressor for nem operon